jgi:hypothetical protein
MKNLFQYCLPFGSAHFTESTSLSRGYGSITTAARLVPCIFGQLDACNIQVNN